MKKLAILLCVVMVLAGTVVGSSYSVKADGDYTSSSLKFTVVEDIDVYNEYTINNLPLDNSKNANGTYIYEVTLEHDGFVSLLLAAREVYKYVTNHKTGETTVSAATLTATVYRDKGLLYPVVPRVTANGLTKGESTQKIALDQGKYYFVVKSDGYLTTKTSTTIVKGNAELIVYYQVVNTNEVYRPSRVGKENTISIDNEFVNLLTASNPKDYYKFDLTNKALVKFNFMYGSTKNAKFVLYSAEREELVSKSISGNSVWYNVEKYLEPGTYYCSLEAVSKDDGGQTNFLITQTVYPLKLTQKNTTKNSYITVSTIEEPKEIRYVKGKLNNSELASSKWRGSKVIATNLKFGVNKIGYYTVRVTDEYGNMFMQSIEVTKCDQKAPSKPIITSYKAGSSVVSGKAEINSMVIVTIKGKSYTCTANSNGFYSCTLTTKLLKGNEIVVTAQDISENVSIKAKVTVK